MKCELCNKPDPRLLFILPLHQADGKLDTIACKACAEKSTAYCRKHDRPHLGFMDGTTACTWCIEELVKAHENRAVQIRDHLWSALPGDQVEELNEAAEISSEVTRSSESVSILRFIASKAMRANETIDDVIYQITESDNHSVSYILWR